jgi:hypothetical protein
MDSLPTGTVCFEAKGLRKIALLFSVVFAAAAMGGYSQPLSAKSLSKPARILGSLCRQDEAVLASGAIRRKLLSVCGRGGRAVYGFGRLGRMEIQVETVHFASRMFSSGGETQLVASRGEYRYVVYDRATSLGWDKEGHNPMVFSSGLRVIRNGRRLADRSCNSLESDIIDREESLKHIREGVYVSRDLFAL